MLFIYIYLTPLLLHLSTQLRRNILIPLTDLHYSLLWCNSLLCCSLCVFLGAFLSCFLSCLLSSLFMDFLWSCCFLYFFGVDFSSYWSSCYKIINNKYITFFLNSEEKLFKSSTIVPSKTMKPFDAYVK